MDFILETVLLPTITSPQIPIKMLNKREEEGNKGSTDSGIWGKNKRVGSQ